MNLFENILAKSNPLPDVKSQFMSGFQQSQPQQQQQPIVQKKPTMSLFSDEVSMLGRMKADGLDDTKSMSLLKQRRSDLLGGNTQLDEAEKSMLLKMQADNLSAKDATALIKKRRADQFDKKYQEGNILQKGAYNALMLGAGATEKTLKYAGNILDFATLGMAGFGEDVKRMEQVTQSPEFDSTAFKAGQVLPDIALAVSPIGGGYLAGARGMTGLQGAKVLSTQGAKNLSKGLMGRSAVVGAGFGATQPILDQGSDATMGDIATGAAIGGISGAVAAPVIGKVLKYGQAGYRGGLTGMGKSIARDTKAGIQAITPSGANISTKANRFNASEIRNFIKMTGQTPGDFATSRGMTKVGDDAVVEATNLWKASKDQADEALQAIKGRFRFTDGGEDLLKTTLDDLETRLVNTKSPDAKRISQLKAKYESSGLTMSEINEVKRLYSQNHKYSFVDAGSEPALRSRNLQDGLRKWQFKVAEENGLTNLKEINKTTQGWKMFADSLSKKIQGSSGNNNVSLTDWIALSGGSPENIALYLGKKLASSDKVKSGAIKLFSKKTKPSIIQASKADIQQSNFQKNVNRGVSGVGDNSGGKSLVRPVGLLPAPSGKATGARNFRVNQPKEKTLIKNEGQVGARPTTPKKPEEQKLLPAPRIPAGTSLPRTDLSAESMRGLSSNVKRPNGNTNNTPNNTGNIPVGNNKGVVTPKKVITPEVKPNTIKNKSVVPKKTVNNPIVKKTMDNDEYFYHGTDPYGFSKIKEEGIIPQRRGVSSLSKTEEYSRNFAFPEATGTKGEMLRVKKDFMKGKLFNTRKQRPKSDEMYEVLTKQTIPPEAIEVLKDGKWQPLITPQSNAKQQVIKPKSTTTNVFGETIDKPSNKKGGFIKIPEIGKKTPVKNPLVEEARKLPKELGKIFTDGTSIDKLKKGITIKMSPNDLYKYQDTKVMNSSLADGEISSSIRNNGYYNDSPVSLIISSDGKIIQLIDGNGRVTASKEIGIKQIPVTVKLSSWDSNIIKRNFGQRDINKDSIDIGASK